MLAEAEPLGYHRTFRHLWFLHGELCGFKLLIQQVKLLTKITVTTRLTKKKTKIVPMGILGVSTTQLLVP
jgi:hypothetical protein